MPEWYTPPQVARSRQLRVGKVLSWIRSGELAAVNCAEKRAGRPRWRISAEALAAFDLSRSNRASIKPKATPRRIRKPADGVIAFF